MTLSKNGSQKYALQPRYTAHIPWISDMPETKLLGLKRHFPSPDARVYDWQDFDFFEGPVWLMLLLAITLEKNAAMKQYNRLDLSGNLAAYNGRLQRWNCLCTCLNFYYVPQRACNLMTAIRHNFDQTFTRFTTSLNHSMYNYLLLQSTDINNLHHFKLTGERRIRKQTFV